MGAGCAWHRADGEQGSNTFHKGPREKVHPVRARNLSA